jgi:hypothetical protein
VEKSVNQSISDNIEKNNDDASPEKVVKESITTVVADTVRIQ